MPKKPTCDLCCVSLDKGQEILKCEGDCGCNVHRYCAGVTKRHFDELLKSSTPYVCEWCTSKTTNAIIQQLQSEVASLKRELAEAKALAVRPSAPPQTHNSYASAAAYTSQLSGHPTNSKGKRALRHSRATQRPNAAPSAAALANPAGTSNPGSPTVNTNHRIARVRVKGARRVCGPCFHQVCRERDITILQD